jgi:branched-chain amino acid transport system ATP-binding protein
MLLRLEGLGAGWGEARILHDISLDIAEGEAVALLGRNGAGKTTLISALMGVARQHAGRIALAGTVLDRLPPERRAALGLGWVPQERNIFRSLTVEDNLTAVARPGPFTLVRAWEFFPRLEQRRGNLGSALSGGEQQMLAMARALMLNPRLLLLDEPLEGLAPVVAQQVLAAIRRMTAEEGLAVLIVEQHPHLVLPITRRAVVLERGRVVLIAASAEIIARPEVAERYLGLAS